MTRKRFIASLSAIPFLGALAARLSASEPMVKVDVAPNPKAEPECVPVCFNTLLWAIGQVENGSDSKPSARGERSKYQLTAAVWRQHEPRLPFTECKGGKAWFVALNHLHWLDRQLPRGTLMERYEREWVLAFAYHHGLTGYRNHRIRPRSSGYASRIQNLYQSRLNPDPKA